MPTYLGYGINFPVVWAGDVRAAGAAFPVVGLILIALRLKARRWQKKKIGADDIFGMIAWITLAVMGACFVYGANHQALGWRSPPQDGNTAQQIANHNSRTDITKLLIRLQYVWQIFMILTYGFTKLSIIWFCRRIFVAHRRTMLDKVTLGLTGLVIAWTFAYFFAYVLYCKGHPSAFWGSPLETKKYCLSIADGGHKLQYSMAITDMILDVFCVSIPFPIIWRLKLTVPQKLSISGIFLIGLTTIGASIARIIAYLEVDATSKDPKEDVFLATTITLYWSMLEAGVAYIASQLPALSQYLTHFSTFRITSSLKRAISWVSLGSLHSRNRSVSDNLPENGRFHELQEKRQSEWLRHGSDATEWSAPRKPDIVKVKGSESSLLPK